MRRYRALFLLPVLGGLPATLASASAPRPEPVPAAALQAYVEPAALAALRAMREVPGMPRRLPFRKILFGPLRSSPDALVISLDEEDPGGICGVNVTQPEAIIRCSRAALEVLFREHKKHREDIPSPLLVFLIAHELSHLIRERSGSFTSRTDVSIPLALPWQKKLATLKDRCNERKEELQIEEQADADAQKALLLLLALPPYLDPKLWKRASLLNNTIRFDREIRELGRWYALRFPIRGITPQSLLTGILEQDADPEYARWAADKTSCLLRSGTRGALRVSLLRGNHPDAMVRAQQLVGALYRSAMTLPEESHPFKPGTIDERSRVLIKLATISLRDRERDATYAKSLGQELCQRATESDFPTAERCRGLGSVPPAACPHVRGGFEKSRADFTPSQIPVTADDRRAVIDADVTMAFPWPGGAVLVGTTNPPMLGNLAPHAASLQAFKIPCTPVATAALRGETAVLCNEPFGLLLTQRGEPHTYLPAARAETAEGVKIDAARIRGTWLSAVADGLSANVSLPSKASQNLMLRGEQFETMQWGYGSQCLALDGGLGLWPLAGRGKQLGVSVDDSSLPPEAAELSAEGERLIRRVGTELQLGKAKVQATGCGPSHLHDGLLCAGIEPCADKDTGQGVPEQKGFGSGLAGVCTKLHGVAYTVGAPGGNRLVARFKQTPDSAHDVHKESVCATRTNLYVLTVAGEIPLKVRGRRKSAVQDLGDILGSTKHFLARQLRVRKSELLEAELHGGNKGAAMLERLQRLTGVKRAGLVCTESAAVAYFSTKKGSLVMPLP